MGRELRYCFFSKDVNFPELDKKEDDEFGYVYGCHGKNWEIVYGVCYSKLLVRDFGFDEIDVIMTKEELLNKIKEYTNKEEDFKDKSSAIYGLSYILGNFWGDIVVIKYT
jgi:hypothetical protein